METQKPGLRGDIASKLIYNAIAVPLSLASLQIGRLWNDKLRAGLEGRAGLFGRLQERQDELRGCVWFHTSSAGEYEQARPIMRALRAKLKEHGSDIPILSTSFSPSGLAHAKQHPEADHVDYLPLDTHSAAWKMMQTLQPRALVFVKFDCWPNMVWSAREAGIPVVLLNAHFHSKSLRKHALARRFFARLFDCFDVIGAISEEDGGRFREIGSIARIEVCGDSRVEQVVSRFQEGDAGSLHNHLRAQSYRYIALGSVWPADTRVVFDACLDALEIDPSLGLITVPHEPHPRQLDELEGRIRARGLEASRLSELVELKSHAKRSTAAAKNPARWRIILVDSVGALAEIYRATILSYVGGSFSSGVHNVLEPAVSGQPVFFGPRIHNADEARRLCSLNAARVVQNKAEAAAALREWLGDEDVRREAGARARGYVQSQLGATERNLALLWPYLRG
jgi:3-deoxy-D-manno-octulosonic-acid transferase